MNPIYVCNVSNQQKPLVMPTIAFDSPPNRSGNNGSPPQMAQTTANSEIAPNVRFEVVCNEGQVQPPLPKAKWFEDTQ